MFSICPPPTVQDILHIATHMRQADRDEVAAASGLSPLEVLRRGVRESTGSFSVRFDEEPLFICGVVEPGALWLLGTDGILKHRRYLHGLAKRVLSHLHKEWPRLGNLVDARNTVHIRWLKAMGFQFGEPVIAGVAQIPFIPFFRELNV